eukprot:GHVS01109095.1.p1 GENE.GHVS01109095.1~~GHVS01109095.1.p1  ORF type:complete len:261 (-),score=38.74 GHVS01109095.1:206-988(-)
MDSCVPLKPICSHSNLHLLRASATDRGDVFVLRLDDSGGENRISYVFMDEMHKLLDVVLEQTVDKNCALVLTGAKGGKFFSNGLRIEDLAEDPRRLLLTFHKLLLRLLTFPMPTVAAINGHAFAGGAMLCMCCDYRIMNREKGFLCVNEVDIGLTLTPGMYSVLRSKANRSEWTEMMLGGKRFDGPTAKARRLVDDAQPAADVFPRAVAVAAAMSSKGSNRPVYSGLKKQMYADEVKMLTSTSLGEAEFLASRVALPSAL